MKTSKGRAETLAPVAVPEQILVVSPSALFRKRIEGPLLAAGYSVLGMGSTRELLRSRRQRPFLACFLDARGEGAGDEADVLSPCLRARPAERYVVVRSRCQREAVAGNGMGEGAVFGYLREPFQPDEAVAWCRRAATEARLQQGDRSLDDILYERFRTFLQNLGPTAMTRFYDLMLERVERPLLTSVLEWTGGNQTRAADILGLHRNTLRAKIRSLKIDAENLANGIR